MSRYYPPLGTVAHQRLLFVHAAFKLCPVGQQLVDCQKQAVDRALDPGFKNSWTWQKRGGFSSLLGINRGTDRPSGPL